MEEKILWDVNKKGQYIVKANYMHMENERIDNYPVGLIWNNRVPPKVSVFTWEVWWGKVLTGDQLKRRGFQLANRCPMCKEEEENLGHLFLHCPTIWRFWALLISLSGMEWVCLLRIRDLMMGWSTFPIRKEAKKLWKAALSSLLWAVWKERNRVTFDNLNFSSHRIKHSFISSITPWAGHLNEGEYPLVN